MNHYDTLSVSQTAPVEVIRAAYKALSQRHHPDKGGDPETMAKINEAWRILSDPDLRLAHDTELSFIRLTPNPFKPSPKPQPAAPTVRRGAPFEVDEELLRKAGKPHPVVSPRGKTVQVGGVAAAIFRAFGG